MTKKIDLTQYKLLHISLMQFGVGLAVVAIGVIALCRYLGIA